MPVRTSQVTSGSGDDLSLNPAAGKNLKINSSLDTNNAGETPLATTSSTGVVKRLDMDNLELHPPSPEDDDWVLYQDTADSKKVKKLKATDLGGGKQPSFGNLPTQGPWVDTNSTLAVKEGGSGSTAALRNSVEFAVNNNTYNQSDKNVVANDMVKIRWMESKMISANHGQTISGTLYAKTGSKFTQTWNLTIDKQPDAGWDLQDLINQPTSTVVESNFSFPSGYNALSPVTIDGGTLTTIEVSINGAAFTSSPGNIKPGEAIQVRGTTGGTDSTGYTALVSIGGIQRTWTVTTGTSVTPEVAQPQITTPADGSTDLGDTVTLISTNYNPLNGAGSHASSDWETYSAPLGTPKMGPIDATPSTSGSLDLDTLNQRDIDVGYGGWFSQVEYAGKWAVCVAFKNATDSRLYYRDVENPSGSWQSAASSVFDSADIRGFSASKQHFIVLHENSVSTISVGASDLNVTWDVAPLSALASSTVTNHSQWLNAYCLEDTDSPGEFVIVSLSRPTTTSNFTRTLKFAGGVCTGDVPGTGSFNHSSENYWRWSINASKNRLLAAYTVGSNTTTLLTVARLRNGTLVPDDQATLSVRAHTKTAALFETPNGDFCIFTAPGENNKYWSEIYRYTWNGNNFIGLTQAEYQDYSVNNTPSLGDAYNKNLYEVNTGGSSTGGTAVNCMTKYSSSGVLFDSFSGGIIVLYSDILETDGTLRDLSIAGTVGGGPPVAHYTALPTIGKNGAVVGPEGFSTAGQDGREFWLETAQARIPLVTDMNLSTLGIGDQVYPESDSNLLGTVTGINLSPPYHITVNGDYAPWVPKVGDHIYSTRPQLVAPPAPNTEPPDSATYTLEYQDLNSTDLESHEIGTLESQTAYYSRVKYRSDDPVESAYSPWNTFSTGSFAHTPGEAMGGGFYAGQIYGRGTTSGGGNDDNGVVYNIIIAPKSSGSLKGSLYGPMKANDLPDGDLFLNHNYGEPASVNADLVKFPIFHPFMRTEPTGPNAGNYDPTNSAGTGIGGYNDWYMPAINELEIIYRTLKPTTDENMQPYTDIAGRTVNSGVNADAVPSPTSQYQLGEQPFQVEDPMFQLGGTEGFNDGNPIFTTGGWWWSMTQAPPTTGPADGSLYGLDAMNGQLSYYAKFAHGSYTPSMVYIRRTRA